MHPTEAAIFLANFKPDQTQPQNWADLGCGDGFFTEVLATKLPAGSKIYAVDKSAQKLKSTVGNNVKIEFIKADFSAEELPLQNLDGILMANSFHYIKDKSKLFNQLKKYLTIQGMLLIIEYDTLRANRWVPYPIDMATLRQLFTQNGFTNITKIGEQNSIYRSGKMYACTIQP